MIKEIVSRLVETDTKKKKGIFVSMYLATSIIQPTNIPQYDSLLAISQKERANGNVSRADSTRALIYLYIYDRFRESNVTKEMAS